MDWQQRKQRGRGSLVASGNVPAGDLAFPSLRPTESGISENLASWRVDLEAEALAICERKMREKISAISAKWTVCCWLMYFMLLIPLSGDIWEGRTGGRRQRRCWHRSLSPGAFRADPYLSDYC